MTPLDLIDELADELRRVFKDYLYRTTSGARVPLNVYKHSLPVSETNDEDDDEDPVPYIIVRLSKGHDDGKRDSSNKVSVVLIIGTFDDSLNQQGYRDVSNIIQKIYERFQKKPSLKTAVYDGEFNWIIQEDDYYPYFFGACNLNFYIAAIRREDEFA